MYWIGGGIAVAGIVAYMVYSSKNTGVSSMTSTTTNGICPAGQVPCANNKNKCYNPSMNYVMDPCATAAVSNTGNDPIVQIVTGIIGLFKKKPAQTTTTAQPAAYPAV